MRGRLLPYLLILVSTLTLPPPALAAEASVRAEIDRSEISAAESLRLKVVVAAEHAEIDLDSLADFIVTRDSTGSGLELTEGRISRARIHTFLLQPKRSGTLEIPAIPVRVAGEVHRTAPLQVRVSAAAPPGRAAPAAAAVILEAEVSNSRPYQGQPLVYTLRILQRGDLGNAQLQRPPMDGFTVVEMQSADRPQRLRRDGLDYRVTTRRYLLTPITVGSVKIAPARLEAEPAPALSAARLAPALSGPASATETQPPRVFLGPPLIVTVQPLPQSGRPADFSGLIGRFSLTAAIDSTRLRLGDSATLTLSLEGRGNLQDSPVPSVPAPEGCRIYPELSEPAVQIDDDGIGGTRIFRYAVVPATTGTFEISAVTLTGFDPDQGIYTALTTSPIGFTVTADTDETAPPAQESQAADGSKQAPGSQTDSGFGATLWKGLDSLRRRAPRSLVQLALPGLVPILVYGLRRRRRRKRHRPPSREQVLRDRALAALESVATAADDQVFLFHLHRAVRGAVLARASRPGEALTHAEVRDLVADPGGDPELADATLAVLRQIEAHRYGAVPLTGADRLRLLQSGRDLIRRLLNSTGGRSVVR